MVRYTALERVQIHQRRLPDTIFNKRKWTQQSTDPDSVPQELIYKDGSQNTGSLWGHGLE